MNYINIKECCDYLLIRICMILKHNLKKFDTVLYKNKTTNTYIMHIIIYKKNKKFTFKLNIDYIISKDEIENLLNSLLDKIETNIENTIFN